MKILFSYNNFVRDFRSSLLVKYVLEALGHRVWLRLQRDENVRFATVKEVDVVLAGQIAEESISYIGKFTSAHGVHLVINSSEQVATPRCSNRSSPISSSRNQKNPSSGPAVGIEREKRRWWLEERGPWRRQSLPTANAKMRRLAEWEKLRVVVGGLYHDAFLDYVRRQRSELVG